MSDNFDLKKYLIENKATTNSKMLSENQDIDNYVDDIVAIASSTQGYQSGLATPSGKEAITDISKELKNNGMLNQVSQALVAYINETPGFTVEDIESLKKHGFNMTGVKLTEMKKKHSKMLNEAETLNLHDMDEDTFDELYIKHITNNAINSEKYLVSKGATPKEAKEIVDEDAVTEGLKGLGVTMTHIATLEVGGTYIDNYKVYDLSDGNVAVEEDYLGMVTIVPMKAFEDFKKAVGGMTETKKKHSKMMKEASDSDREAIENWYHRTNFYIDDLSPEEIEKGIQDHYEEWTAEKSKYNSIEDYFADVERNSDWY